MERTFAKSAAAPGPTWLGSVIISIARRELYEAVVMEAGRRLSSDDGGFVASRHLPPEQKLLQLVESLLERLSGEHAWIAKLLTQELVDPASTAHNYAAFGLERDFVLLQAVMRDFLGAKANGEAIRLHALSVIGECVFCCLVAGNLRHALIQVGGRLPGRAQLVRFVAQRALGGLELEGAEPKAASSNPLGGN